jgi:hypothetical protein
MSNVSLEKAFKSYLRACPQKGKELIVREMSLFEVGVY